MNNQPVIIMYVLTVYRGSAISIIIHELFE